MFMTRALNRCEILYLVLNATIAALARYLCSVAIKMSVTPALRSQLFIGGKFVAPQGGKTFDVFNPATEELLGRAPLGETADIDTAVKCARESFDSGVWSSLSGAQRAVVLRRVSVLVKQYKPILSEKEARNNGKPHREAEWDIDDVSGSFDYYADLAEQLDAKQGSKIASPDARFDIALQYQPVGVVGAIVPWNYPLLMCAWKLAPALASGCSVVLKPSELTPFTALDLAAIIHEAGVPPGVLNVVTGLGVTPSCGQTHLYRQRSNRCQGHDCCRPRHQEYFSRTRRQEPNSHFSRC